MKILLVMPRVRTFYGRDVFMPMMNLTLMYLKALIEKIAARLKIAVSITVIDERMQDEALVASKEYDAVMMSFMTGNNYRANDIADEFRALGIPVIAGGIYPSLFPNEVAQYATSVVVGEAELVFEQLVNDLFLGCLKPRYEAGDVCDLKDLPDPDYSVFEHIDFFNSLPLFATRGCYFNCSYCTIAKLCHNAFTMRPVDDIYHQMKRTIKSYGSKALDPLLSFNFVDDNLCANKIYFKKLCRKLIDLETTWIGTGSLTTDPELWKLAADAGCKLMFFGLESVYQQNLDYLNKKHNKVDRYRQCIDAVHEAGIEFGALMMAGLPFDDEHVFDNTLKFAEETGIEALVMSLFTPIPGTAQWDKKDWHNAKEHKDFKQVSEALPVYWPKGKISHTDFKIAYIKYQRALHSPRSLAIRIKAENSIGTKVSQGYGSDWAEEDWMLWAKDLPYDCSTTTKHEKTDLDALCWQQNSRKMADVIIAGAPKFARKLVKNKMLNGLNQKTDQKNPVSEDMLFTLVKEIAPKFIHNQIFAAIEPLRTQQ